MSRGRILAGFVLVLTGVVCFYWILPAWRDYRKTQRDVLELRKQLAGQEKEIRRLKRDIAALKNDPYAVERVAREKFGWCRDGEKIYHFDGPNPTTSRGERNERPAGKLPAPPAR